MSVIRSGNSSGPDAATPDPRASASTPDNAAALIATSQKARGEKTWIITDGSVGMEAQGIAVAEAVGLPFSLKRVRLTGPMRLVPAALQLVVPPRRLLGFVAANEPLEAPWPRLIISIGRRGVPIALAVKRLSGSQAFAAYPESQSSSAPVRSHRCAGA